MILKHVRPECHAACLHLPPTTSHADWDVAIHGCGQQVPIYLSFRYLRGLDLVKWSDMFGEGGHFHETFTYVDAVRRVVDGEVESKAWHCQCTERAYVVHQGIPELVRHHDAPTAVLIGVGVWALPSVRANKMHYDRPLASAVLAEAEATRIHCRGCFEQWPTTRACATCLSSGRRSTVGRECRPQTIDPAICSMHNCTHWLERAPTQKRASCKQTSCLQSTDPFDGRAPYLPGTLRTTSTSLSLPTYCRRSECWTWRATRAIRS